ncbi:helix-turn-helix domain-containing protein [Stenotrophomonas terrae]|uniref:helix-turn-helix domain-containing protein n=1 Tax=Stenotrophomonas terrae TaxID=405446 RepID=UPI00320B9519
MTVTRVMRHLARKQLDHRFAALRSIPKSILLAPKKGWIRAIREALGMPRRAFAKRLGVSVQRVARIELGEENGTISMTSLSNAAEALDCELLVILLPRRSLEEEVSYRRAQLVASWLQSRVIGTFNLSGLTVAQESLPLLAIHEINKLFPDERLWEEHP